FPQPDGPTKTINSLSSISKLKSWMTSLPFLSYLFLIFFNFILDMNLFHLPERSNYNVSLQVNFIIQLCLINPNINICLRMAFTADGRFNFITAKGATSVQEEHFHSVYFAAGTASASLPRQGVRRRLPREGDFSRWSFS